MDQTLVSLMNLQEADFSRKKYQEARGELRKRLEVLEQLLERGLKELADKKAKLSSAESFYSEKSIELKADEERAKQSKSKLSAVTRQKEYLASQKELDFLKKSNSKKQEEINNLLQAIDEYKAGIQENQDRITKLENEVKEERESNAEKLDALEKDLVNLDSKRSTIATDMKSSVLKKYERILKAREGIAVVPVLPGGTCTGCNMRIQAQSYILLLKSKSYSNCSSCQRFIYAAAEEETVEVPQVEEAAAG